MVSIKWSIINDDFQPVRVRPCDVPADVKKDLSEIATTQDKTCRLIRGEYWVADVTIIDDLQQAGK